ncbi:hypothetical protein CHI12_16365 [Terribacillus saccharophilus]|jgi:uncharacterized protein|uniref:DUF554 domain-containing protein n=1 Tax=Terribacillus saccharophilus TaxID=361277 RepID=A0A268H984_9BACI|nr:MULTISPECIES: DUF554 domain-containing protein [Terribacillus]PAD35896.1 hypothetical protein CHH56_07220 [Terribacillus saccharophilus]PAD96238.1 hypothetical protein CHH50_09330 [Terribacillus saccharophilus]PAD99813.1 hypothetical protein CHH48_10235 [Terribacillus saccharophilus]PAE06413.1 hypothetical protein CHI12_16365 [Terribacillus saccharophilus]VVM35239.1 putative transport protein [Terribacillus sp. AE2B 122]
MFGTLFNVAMIIIGSTLGTVFKKGMKDRYQTILMQAMGLAALALGVNAIVGHLPDSKYSVLFIISLAIGAIVGEKLDLDARFTNVVKKFSKSNLAEGLSTAILLFCIGSLSILGPVEAALHGNYSYLLANGMLDFVTSLVLASTFGFGIALSAGVLFVWQGSIYVVAKALESAVNVDLLNEVSIVGGVLIMASGLSILGIKKFKTMNFLPALLVPPVFFLILKIF